MKCFYDPSQDAVGACKSCGRGLSASYLTAYPRGLACKGVCEADVLSLIALIEQNVSLRKASATLIHSNPMNYYAAFIFYVVLGGIFVWMGSDRREWLNPVSFIGLAFIVFGIYTLMRGKRLRDASRGAVVESGTTEG